MAYRERLLEILTQRAELAGQVPALLDLVIDSANKILAGIRRPLPGPRRVVDRRGEARFHLLRPPPHIRATINGLGLIRFSLLSTELRPGKRLFQLRQFFCRRAEGFAHLVEVVFIPGDPCQVAFRASPLKRILGCDEQRVDLGGPVFARIREFLLEPIYLGIRLGCAPAGTLDPALRLDDCGVSGRGL